MHGEDKTKWSKATKVEYTKQQNEFMEKGRNGAATTIAKDLHTQEMGNLMLKNTNEALKTIWGKT